MLRRTALGTLAAAALTSTLLAGAAPADAQPTWVLDETISGEGTLPSDSAVAVADDGSAVAAWVRAVGPDQRVQVASATNGVWGAVHTISDAGRDASDPAVAINDDGEAVVSWVQPALGDDLRLAAARRLSGGTWDGRVLVSPQNEDVTGTPQVALDGDGRMVAAYETAAGNAHRVRVTTWAETGATPQWSVVSGASTDAYAPALALNDDGAGLISFHDGLGPGPESSIRLSTKASGSNYWPPAVDVFAPGQHGLVSDVAVDDSGFGIVAYAEVWQGKTRVQTVKVQPDGDLGNPSFASPATQDAGNPSVDLNADGDALLAWQSIADGQQGIGYASSKKTGSWSAAAQLSVDIASPSAPTASIADNGTTMITYGGNGRMRAAYRTKALLPYTSTDFGPGFVNGSVVSDMDSQGNGLVAGILPDQMVGVFLDAAGPAIQVKAPAHALGSSYQLSWSGTDELSAVQDADVVVRRAAWNGSFGDPVSLANDTDAASLQVKTKPGRTTCASVQLRDSVGNLSTWAERCTTAPVDDRAFDATTGWITAKGKGHYRGTILTTVDKNARLTLKGAKAKRIALVVAKAPKAGKVRVTFAGKDLGTFSLKGTGKKKVVPVKTFGSVKSGKLQITVVSPDGKPVKIDGVVLAAK